MFPQAEHTLLKHQEILGALDFPADRYRPTFLSRGWSFKVLAAAPNSHTRNNANNLASPRAGTARRWNPTFWNTDATNPRTNTGSLIHLLPKTPGAITPSWEVVMKSLRSTERCMQRLTCRRGDRTPCGVSLAGSTSAHTWLQLLACLKWSVYVSALLDWGLCAGQPRSKKSIASKLLNILQLY